MIEIQLYNQSSADFTQIIDLDNITCTIRLTYNIRVGFFFMNILTENNELSGLKVVLNFPILYPHRALFPELPGDFFINKVTNEDENTEFSYENFGEVYKLIYYNADELAEWWSGNGF